MLGISSFCHASWLLTELLLNKFFRDKSRFNCIIKNTNCDYFLSGYNIFLFITKMLDKLCKYFLRMKCSEVSKASGVLPQISAGCVTECVAVCQVMRAEKKLHSSSHDNLCSLCRKQSSGRERQHVESLGWSASEQLPPGSPASCRVDGATADSRSADVNSPPCNLTVKG